MLRATLTGGSFYIIEILYKIFYCLFFCQNCLFIGKQYCLSSFYRSKRIEALLFRIKHLLWNQAIVVFYLFSTFAMNSEQLYHFPYSTGSLEIQDLIFMLSVLHPATG